MTDRETIPRLMVKYGIWDGGHVKPDGSRNSCVHCGHDYRHSCTCPGPEEWPLDQLFRLLFRAYWYVDVERRGEDIFVHTVDPDFIMSMSSINKQVSYSSDADYVDPIVNLRSALEAAILGSSQE